MTEELTEKDRKVLKFEKRPGYVFAGLILCFGGLFNLIYFLIIKSEFNYLMIGLIDLGIIALSYFVLYKVNYKINLDLKENKKELLNRTVDKKVVEKSYEAGSGSLFIPFLGNLFPKLWGQKMNEAKKYYIISNEYKHEVDLITYNDLKKGTDFFIHFAKHSGIILNLSNDK
ncbi:MAG: hypothetical protein AB7S48_09600 [Bacteroidales bacterium]